jgi:hypothetical protein
MTLYYEFTRALQSWEAQTSKYFQSAKLLGLVTVTFVYCFFCTSDAITAIEFGNIQKMNLKFRRV